MTDRVSPKKALFDTLQSDSVRSLLDDISPPGTDSSFYVASLSAVLQETPELVTCSHASLVRCAYLAASLGVPMGKSGVWITPRKVDGVKTAVPVIDYRAMIELALAHPKVAAIHSNVVRDGDDISIDLGNTEKPVTHRVDVTRQDAARRLGAWAEIIMVGGHHLAVWMPWTEIEQIMGNTKVSRAHPSEMGRKTVLRRLLKHAPQTPAIAQALAIENAVDTDPGSLRNMAPDLPGLEGGGDESTTGSAPAPARPKLADRVSKVRKSRLEEDADAAQRGHDAAEQTIREAEPIDPERAPTIAQEPSDDELADMIASGPAGPTEEEVEADLERQRPTTDASEGQETGPPETVRSESTESAPFNAKTEVARLLGECDAAAVGDPEVNGRFAQAVKDVTGGGTLRDVTTPEQVAALRTATFI